MTDDTLRELLDVIGGVLAEHSLDGDGPADGALRLALEAAGIPALLADRAERDGLRVRLAASERREKVAQEYVKKLDGIIEEVGGVTASCINPYEDLKRALQGQKARAEKAEAELAALREAVNSAPVVTVIGHEEVIEIVAKDLATLGRVIDFEDQRVILLPASVRDTPPEASDAP